MSMRPTGPLEPSLQFTFLRTGEEVRLPASGRVVPTFRPRSAALDEILRPFSLDERVRDILRPRHITPSLMEPMEMSGARDDIHNVFLAQAEREDDVDRREKLLLAADIVADELLLSDEIRAALATLLRG